MNIRPMLEDDADAVRRVDTLAFTPLFVKTGAARNAAGEFPLRTRENILAARGIFPQGCFVADPAHEEPAGNELAGYIFARAWGAVGWVGVFGVHPQYQGRRVGQELLERSLAALRTAGCTTVGLETIPDSYYNIGLYARQGFRPITMTFSLEKAVGLGGAGDAVTGTERDAVTGGRGDAETRDAAGPLSAPLYAAGAAGRALLSEDERGLDEVSRISQAAWPGLDLRAEAANAVQYGWGQAVLVGEPAHTIAIARVVNRRENAIGSAAGAAASRLYEVTALAALPGTRGRAAGLAQTLEGFAAQQGFTHLRLILNSADWQSLQALLEQGYRVVHSALRLMLAGEYGGHPGLEFSRWAM